MRKIGIFLLFSILTVSLFAQKKETSRKRYALVIGNKDYKYEKIDTAENDAELITKSLKSKEFDVTLKKNLDDKEMREVVEQFISKINADSNSVALFYFTGHAFTEDRVDNSDFGKNYILPINNTDFSDADGAKDYGLDLENDIAGKIKTVAQIYMIDGAYENPFKTTGTRALGVKAGLSQNRIAKSSTVGFLFSTAPGSSVKKSFFKNTHFAKAISKEIDDSDENLSAVFENVKSSVSKSTAEAQNPYSSATTLQFAFNGDELTALQKASAQASADSTEINSIELNRAYKKELAEKQALKDSETAASIDVYNKNSKEVAEKRRLQQIEDERRKAEEEALSASRSNAANQQILALREEFEASAATLSESMKKNAQAPSRVEYIENMKENLYGIRETAKQQVLKFNAETDADTIEKVNEVWNAEIKLVESDGEGGLNESARKRRKNSEEKIRTEAASKKFNYKSEKEAQVAVDDKKWLPKIKSAYNTLEKDTYSVTSFDDSMTVRVDNYDGGSKTWKLHVSVDMFGHVDVFEDDIYLSYEKVTGKKVNLEKMNSYQLDAYNDDVMIYDSLFRSSTPVFYVKLSYKIMRWADASEYHFIPKKCEIIRLGKKNKVISKVSEEKLNTSNFTQYPSYEIRSIDERADDAERASSTEIKEQKLRGTYIDPKVELAKSNKDTNNYNPSSNSDDKKRTGRSGFFVTGGYESSDIFSNDYFKNNLNASNYEKPKSYNVEVHLNLSPARFFYTGFSGGVKKIDFGNYKNNFSEEYISENKMEENVYFGKIVDGLTVNIGQHFRPFIEAGIAFYASPFNPLSYQSPTEILDLGAAPGSDKVIGLSVGGGFDIALSKHTMIIFGVDYNWMHYLRSFTKGVIVVDDTDGFSVKSGFLNALKTPDFHTTEFKIGLGFTW